MANAAQLKSLIRSHYENDVERFNTIVLQLAAHEAQVGHSSLAYELRTIVDQARKRNMSILPSQKDGLDELISRTETPFRLKDLIVSDNLKIRIERILKEYHQQDKLRQYGLGYRRKILLSGPSGTGKTMTAAIIASELHLPFYTILMDKLITKYMGETSAKLRQIFDGIIDTRCVYLFDEFDAIGTERSRDNDVGEMRRVLNAFLQFIERDESDNFIIAATNTITLLDNALFRRFDDVLHYLQPTKEQIIKLIENRLGTFLGKIDMKSAAENAEKLSHAEITQACDDAVKESILADQSEVPEELLMNMLKERRSAYNHLNES